MRTIYSCIDRDGVVYRHWRTTEADARHYAARHTEGDWTMLVDGRGRIVATSLELRGF